MWRKSSHMNGIPKGWEFNIVARRDLVTLETYEINDRLNRVQIIAKIDNETKSIDGKMYLKDYQGAPDMLLTFSYKVRFGPIEIMAILVFKYFHYFMEIRDKHLAGMMASLINELCVKQETLEMVADTSNSVELVIDKEEEKD
jgi:hypothetical protein